MGLRLHNITVDDSFWHAQVHTPALTWLASGSRGSQKTPAEQLAMGFMQGGLKAIAPNLDHQDKGDGGDFPEKPFRKNNRRRKSGKGESAGTPRPAVAVEDINKEGAGNSKQKCFAWNNNNGVCFGLPPGSPCASKIKREHRCTICNCPGHPSHSCPKKKE